MVIARRTKLEREIQEQSPEQIVQAVMHIEYLYGRLSKLNLLDAHEHCMAHRTIDLITKIREFHRDLENPPDDSGEKKIPSVADFIALELSHLFKKDES